MNLNDMFENLKNRQNAGEWSEYADENETSRGGLRQWGNQPWIRKLSIAAVAAVILFSVLLPWSAGFITDFYWFDAQGFASIFWKRLLTKWIVLAAAVIPALVIYLANWLWALKHSHNLALAMPGVKVKRGIIFAAVIFAVVNGVAAADKWQELLQFMNGVPFGKTDPLFGRDIGFYVFKLPFITFCRSWFSGILFVTLCGLSFIYFTTRTMLVGRNLFNVPKFVRVHLTITASLMLLLMGAGFVLDRYELLYSPTGVVFGAGYTDLHVILPALNVMCGAMALAAVLLLVNIARPMWKASAVIVIGMLVIGFAVRALAPAVVQQYIVKPNEFEMERPFLAHSLEYTRRAFGLDRVKSVQVTPEAEVTAGELASEEDTVRDIRMWDYSPLLRTFRQLQAIRTYYNFKDVFIDRYKIDGKNRQVMLAVRELDLSKLQNPTWVNTHLEFTHGYGLVMNPVNEIAAGGMPEFFMKDIPVNSKVDIPLKRPEIYYGVAPKRNSYVLVKTDVKEFDYPMGDSNVRSEYTEDGGVSIGSLWRRIIFALKFQDSEILFTGALKPESRVLYNRNVFASFIKTAPFLIFDADTYPIITDGRILWMQDAFTWSNRYPYSQPFYANGDDGLDHFSGVNYVRNSVKATADAYTGKMTFYIVDKTDPIIRTWAKIFPKLFKNADEMPQDVWSHIRYPEDFFEVQTAMHTTYHMTDPNTYYNREDVWEVTPAGREKRIAPNYVTMKLWGEKSPEFAVIVPYMPLGRDNLIGWMAGRCDPENYGQLLVYQFPKQKLIYGPGQVEALIDQNPEISAQLSLWSQRGSDVIRGDLLVVPIGKSLLYVQPLYLKAEQGELPELKRVIVSTGGRVAWGENFESALEKLMGTNAIKAHKKNSQSASNEHGTTQPAQNSQQAAASGTMAEMAHNAQLLFNEAQAAQRAGNWGQYGEKINALGALLEKMNVK